MFLMKIPIVNLRRRLRAVKAGSRPEEGAALR
jgi:hypothetical protein